ATLGLLRFRSALPSPLRVHSIANSTLDPEGPALLPSRPRTVVSISDFFRVAQILFLEHQAPWARSSGPKPLLAQSARAPQSSRDSVDTFDVYDALHFPTVVAGRPQFLDSRLVAIAARVDLVGQICLRRRHIACCHRSASHSERRYAWN